MLALSRKRSDFANGCFEWHEMLVADVVAEKARHGAHGARVSVSFVDRAVKGHFAGIEADARPRLAEARAEVFFAGHEIDRSGLRAVSENEIHERVFRRFLPGFGDVVDRFPFKLLQFLFFRRSDQNTWSATAVIKEVFPIGMIAREFLLNARADGGILQPLE